MLSKPKSTTCSMLFMMLFVLLLNNQNINSINIRLCPEEENECGHNNTCYLVDNELRCACQPNLVGSRCQLKNPCEPKPCGANGVCLPYIFDNGDGLESTRAYCQCYFGWFGDRCEMSTSDPCASSPCHNNGICSSNYPTSSDFKCTCFGLYTGPTCGTYIDYCANHICQNGAACIPIESTKSYICECLSGFLGNFCQNQVEHENENSTALRRAKLFNQRN